MRRTRPQNKSASPNFGTAALQELLSKSPTLRADFVETQRAYRMRLAQIESKLAGDEEIRRHLDRLERAKADRAMVLQILAIEIEGRQKRGNQRASRPWRQEMRQRNRNLRSLARGLESIASEVEKTYADTATHPDLFRVALLIVREGAVTPASKRVPRKTIKGMRACAADLLEKARQIGDILKKETPGIKRGPGFSLLRLVQVQTGDAKRHLQSLAEMLHAAYELFRIKQPVSTESLEKLLVRHVLPRLKPR